MFLEPMARLQTRHTPPGSLPANALSLVPRPSATFSQPLGGFSVTQVWLGLLRLEQAVTNRSVPSLPPSTTGTQGQSTFSVGRPTLSPASPPALLVPAPTTPDPTQDSSTRRRKRNTHLANPYGPPHRLATPFFHIPLLLSGTLPVPQLWLVLSLGATLHRALRCSLRSASRSPNPTTACISSGPACASRIF